MQTIQITYDPKTGDVKMLSEIERPILLLGILEFAKGMVSRIAHSQDGKPIIEPAIALPGELGGKPR